jgi:hypothetical protein
VAGSFLRPAFQEVGLGGFQLGRLVFAGGTEFCLGIFDLQNRRVVINQLL